MKKIYAFIAALFVMVNTAFADTVVPATFTLADVLTDIGVVFAALLGVAAAVYGGRKVLSLFRA